MQKPEQITICEFDYLYPQAKSNLRTNGSGCRFVPIKNETFKNLKQFVLENDPDNDPDTPRFMRLTSKHGTEMLQAYNYVGVITTSNGSTVEILPKIAKVSRKGDEEVRGMFLDMLRRLRNAPWKNLGRSTQLTERMPLYEIFISMFVTEVEDIAKHGFRSGYIRKEGNLRAIKGKILFEEHIKRNYIDQSRVYVQYSSYELDRPENRVLKAALALLFHKTTSSSNRSRIRRMLEMLSGVHPSANYHSDYAQCQRTRDNAYYDQALRWTHIFLEGKTFTAFKGKTVSEALLFPMERIFEDYIAVITQEELHKLAPRQGALPAWKVYPQHSSRYLFDSKRSVYLKPDILLSNKESRVVLDTKWKIPDKGSPSQGDQYQMYAYGNRYVADHVVLIYPASEQEGAQDWSSWSYRSHEEETAQYDVRAYFIDLQNEPQARKSIRAMLEEWVIEDYY